MKRTFKNTKKKINYTKITQAGILLILAKSLIFTLKKAENVVKCW